MIRWIFEKMAVEVSLNVEDCDTHAIAQFRSTVEGFDRTEALKQSMTGIRHPRYGAIGESMIMNAHQLGHAMSTGLKPLNPVLTEGKEVYDRYNPKKIPKGVKL